MFSANENIALRQHKRRVVSYIEECIDESVLDAGTSVMVMQISCKTPGCVPLETAIVIIFPRYSNTTTSTPPKLLIPGLPESKSGGSYKTKILLPLSDITKEDVLDALPPSFDGGRKTMKRLCLKARDVMLAQIGQILGNDDNDNDNGDEDDDGVVSVKEEKKLMAEYLMSCLREYIANDCIPPPIGQPYNNNNNNNNPNPTKQQQQEEEEEEVEDGEGLKKKESKMAIETPSFLPKYMLNNNDKDDNDQSQISSKPEPKSNNDTLSSSTLTLTSSQNQSNNHNVVTKSIQEGMNSGRNFIFRRPTDDYNNDDIISNKSNANETKQIVKPPTPTPTTTTTTQHIETATDWRRRQDMEQCLNNINNSTSTSSNSIIRQLAAKEHEPGIRRRGCPCCDPDDISNFVDSIRML